MDFLKEDTYSLILYRTQNLEALGSLVLPHMCLSLIPSLSSVKIPTLAYSQILLFASSQTVSISNFIIRMKWYISHVLAGLLNMLGRADWRTCELSKEEEIKMVEELKKLLKILIRLNELGHKSCAWCSYTWSFICDATLMVLSLGSH